MDYMQCDPKDIPEWKGAELMVDNGNGYVPVSHVHSWVVCKAWGPAYVWCSDCDTSRDFTRDELSRHIQVLNGQMSVDEFMRRLNG